MFLRTRIGGGGARIISRHRPDVFIGENVVGFGAAKGSRQRSDLQYLAETLSQHEYHLVDFRINAESYGSPSPRDRCSVR